MPLHWTIDPTRRLVTAVADGDVTREEFDTFLGALEESGAYAYRKLFDGARGRTRMAAEEVLALGARMRASHAHGPVGPLAVVVPDGQVEMISRVLGILAAADRPMRIFRQVELARKWIESLPR
jgi:hypothetical protein